MVPGWLMAEQHSGMDAIVSGSPSASQGCSRASPGPDSTLKPSTVMPLSHLKPLLALWQGGKDSARPPGASTRPGHPSPLPPVLQSFLFPGTGQVTAPEFSPSIPNLAPRRREAAVSRSSATRSYTLTGAVSSLSPLCAPTLEPECLCVGAFPSMSPEIRADLRGHGRCRPGVTPGRRPRVSGSACSGNPGRKMTCQQPELQLQFIAGFPQSLGEITLLFALVLTFLCQGRVTGTALPQKPCLCPASSSTPFLLPHPVLTHLRAPLLIFYHLSWCFSVVFSPVAFPFCPIFSTPPTLLCGFHSGEYASCQGQRNPRTKTPELYSSMGLDLPAGRAGSEEH